MLMYIVPDLYGLEILPLKERKFTLHIFDLLNLLPVLNFGHCSNIRKLLF